MPYERWSIRHAYDRIDQKLDHMHEQIHSIKEGLLFMSAAMDRLTAEAAETTSAVDGVLVLLEGIAQQLRDSAEDPAKINAIADELDASQSKIAAAVTANTPAEEPPVEEPPVEEPPVVTEPPVEEPPVT